MTYTPSLALPISLMLSLGLSGATLAAPVVVATTKPLHALTAMVMGEAGAPKLLVSGSNSPHAYALRPSDAAALEAADIVLWTGPGMELFLAQALETLAIDATVVSLADTPGLTLLPVREGGAFEAHAHGEDEGHDGHDHEEHAHEGHDHEGHAHDDHDHGAFDMHYWLDPENARLMVAEIARTLSAADPDNAALYAANAAAADAALMELTAELAGTLTLVAERPFIMFHDALQYFEARFGLSAVGSITVTPDLMPGAARIGELRARITEAGAACVFAEPQFSAAVVATITEGTPARTAVLDPEGATLEPGAELYPALLRGLAGTISGCLDD